MEQIVTVNKPVGKTPFQMVELYKKKFPQYKNEKIGYAGRLDPMAEGVLVLLIGETNKKKKEYESLDKKYTFQIVLGMETDSYDLLGLVRNSQLTNQVNVRAKADEFFRSIRGNYTQKYPPYSSVRVKGKPLFYWAREEKLNKIEIPTKQVELYDAQVIDDSFISASELRDFIETRIQLVEGNFRQEEILERWNKFFENNDTDSYPTLTCSVHCSSGTYVRSIVHELGKKIGTGATTLSIKRTRVGGFMVDRTV